MHYSNPATSAAERFRVKLMPRQLVVKRLLWKMQAFGRCCHIASRTAQRLPDQAAQSTVEQIGQGLRVAACRCMESDLRGEVDRGRAWSR